MAASAAAGAVTGTPAPRVMVTRRSTGCPLATTPCGGLGAVLVSPPASPICATVELPSETRVPTCLSDAYALHYVLGGAGTAVSCREGPGRTVDEVALRPGDTVLFPPGTTHSVLPEDGVGSLVTLAIVCPGPRGAGQSDAYEYADSWRSGAAAGHLSQADVELALGVSVPEAWGEAAGEGGGEGEDDEGDEGGCGAPGGSPGPLASAWLGRGHHDGALRKRLCELLSFSPPNGDKNRLALVFDGEELSAPFTVALEIFSAGHHTPPHSHAHAHEAFFILRGTGEAFAAAPLGGGEGGHGEPERVRVGPGDMVIMPPGSLHGINNDGDEPMYCLELMAGASDGPQFARFVKSGAPAGELEGDDLCNLVHVGCGV